MKFNADGYLDAGIHDVELPAIEEHFVDGFPSSNTRPKIINGYKQHRAELESLNLDVEQLLDGSFVSTKNDPNDIDLVCFADADAIDRLSPQDQEKFSKLLSGKHTQSIYLCDAYFSPMVPENHPQYNQCRSARKYWMGEFGYDRNEKPKGVLRVRITVPDGDEA
jgi:hypothetical protein